LFSEDGWKRLEVGGTLVGAFANTIYEQAECQLQPGNTIVLFSDGIVEARNTEGEEFGEQRIREAIEPRVGEPVERILERLLDALGEFTRGIPQADDLTAVVVRYVG
jgi:sigma-B regulation protein RsbU (phosphoserine phosphatase)